MDKSINDYYAKMLAESDIVAFSKPTITKLRKKCKGVEDVDLAFLESDDPIKAFEILLNPCNALGIRSEKLSEDEFNKNSHDLILIKSYDYLQDNVVSNETMFNHICAYLVLVEQIVAPTIHEEGKKEGKQEAINKTQKAGGKSHAEASKVNVIKICEKIEARIKVKDGDDYKEGRIIAARIANHIHTDDYSDEVVLKIVRRYLKFRECMSASMTNAQIQKAWKKIAAVKEPAMQSKDEVIKAYLLENVDRASPV